MAGNEKVWFWVREAMKHAPELVKLAQDLRVRQQRAPEPPPRPDPAGGLGPRIADLESRVQRLQENESQQAGLVSDMAKQMEALARSLDALAGRFQLLLWLSGGALVVGLAALIAALV